MALKRILASYRNFFNPAASNPKPPYTHICQVGDPVLRKPASEVPLNDLNTPAINEILQSMKTVLKSYGSFGVSAPQIGVPMSIIMFQLTHKNQDVIGEELFRIREMKIQPLTIFVNPKLKVLDYEKISFSEGCASLRGYSAVVPRYRKIELSGFNEKGEPKSLTANGWLARIIQHEMDHLDGKLYIDSMDINTFQNDCWHKVNVRSGRIKIVFHGN